MLSSHKQGPMADKKKSTKTVSIITPFGTLRYPKISQPDTKGEYADGKHKTDIVFSDEDYKSYEKKLKAAAKQLAPEGTDPDSLKLPLYDEWEEGKGTRAKSQYKPVILNGKNQEIAEKKQIGGGTIARLAVAAAFYPKKGKNPAGLTLYLNKVQIKTLVEYQGGGEFDEIEGDEADEGDDTSSGDESFDSL